MSRQLFKSTVIVSSMTMISRILGFVRDMLLARIFGVDASTDAFYIAFKIPNFLRRLFTEGAFAQAFVPVLSDYKEHGSTVALKLFIDKTGGTLAILLMLMSIAGMIFAPVLITIFAPGFNWSGGQYELAVELLRIILPYLFFIASVAFAGGILNTHGKFAIPAITPVLLNICMIAAAIWLAPLMPQPILALAWGVFAAGGVQLLVQFPALMRLGLLPRLRFGFNDPGVKKFMALMLPAIFGASVSQINLLLDSVMATFLKPGSVSWLYYSDRLVEFPLGIIGIALATVILPGLSKSHVSGNAEKFSQALDWGLRWVLLIGLPTSTGLVVLARPILSSIFQYGEFSSRDVIFSSQSLMAYAFGLLGFMLIKILAPGFTARQDMRTPVKFGIYSLIANIVLSVLLMFPLAHGGLALATSLAAFLNAGLLLRRLLKEHIYIPEPGWWRFGAQLLLANNVMAGALIYGVDADWWNHWSASERISYLGIAICLAGLTYFFVLFLLGLRHRHLTGELAESL